MKKSFILFLIILCIISISACSNNTSTDTSTDTTKTQTEDTKDNTTNTTTDTSLVGDWKYTGNIDNKNYEIELDLDQDSEFELKIDEESNQDTEDSEAKGTYVVDGSIIRLSIQTVQDTSSYFTGTVVQNGQVELQYTLKENDLTLNNLSDSISILPGEITLKRS